MWQFFYKYIKQHHNKTNGNFSKEQADASRPTVGTGGQNSWLSGVWRQGWPEGENNEGIVLRISDRGQKDLGWYNLDSIWGDFVLLWAILSSWFIRHVTTYQPEHRLTVCNVDLVITRKELWACFGLKALLLLLLSFFPLLFRTMWGVLSRLACSKYTKFKFQKNSNAVARDFSSIGGNIFDFLCPAQSKPPQSPF